MKREESNIELSEFELKDKFYHLNLESLYHFKTFFNHFFSYCYPFDEADLLIHQNKIILGSPSGLNSFGYSEVNYGLIFNKNNIWNQKTLAIYYKEPQVIYTGGGTDEYSFELKLNRLPYHIDFDIESKIIKNITDNQCINDEEIKDESNYMNLEKELNDIKEYYSGIKSKVNFDLEIVFKIIRSNNQDYFCNQFFCKYLLNKILEDIDDFKIEKFYNNI